MYPKLYLTIDNCFASKRWTEPEEWMEVIQSLDIRYVEGSADTECDPMYMGEDYLARWIDKVNRAKSCFGIEMSNLYSGHGTYATLGLAHTNPEIRTRFLDNWLKKMVQTAHSVDAGLGFFCHAFSDVVLQDPGRYAAFRQDLLDNLTELARYAAQLGSRPIAVEQMYSPHQIPWTVDGAKALLQAVQKGGAPFYLTIDTGHQTGQRKFLRPDDDALFDLITAHDAGAFQSQLWLGSSTALSILERTEDSVSTRAKAIAREMDRCPYLFAQSSDGDTYHWLRELGAYSPIVHLQQTDGEHSAHRPFTQAENDRGIIDGRRVLEALAHSFQKPPLPGMPPRVERIYLTLEIFTNTAAINRDQLDKIRQSIAYWRQFVPQDGLPLDQLLQ